MKNYSEEEIHSLIKRFEARQLPKVEWAHQAHLVVAIWYCSNYAFDEALKIVRTNITEHNNWVGTPNTDIEGYHETLTKFWLLNANGFLTNRVSKGLAKNCNDFINSAKGDKNYPSEFYSKELLFSVQARHHWVAPDLKELKMPSNSSKTKS